MNTPVGAGADTTPPTAPTNLTASPSGGQINLSWTASTDNVGVAGYLIERENPGGTTFVQVGTSAGTTFSDTAVAGGSTYTYRVRATDFSNNLSPYSNTAQATAKLGITPPLVEMTVSQTQQFTANTPGVIWSVDGVVGGSAASGTITTAGLYTPPNSVGTHLVTATTSDQSQSVNASVYVSNYAGAYTYHSDNARTGANLNETALTPSNVNSTQFGKLATYQLDGTAYAEPLYVANLTIPGQGAHNVVFVATMHDSVYAFDADGLSSTPLWKDSFINPAAGITPVPPADVGDPGDILTEIGITSTPVIDPSSNTIYVVAKTKEVSGNTTNYVQRLHALDLTTGAEKFGGPVVIQASVPGTGDGSFNGTVTFNPLRQLNRPALLLSNGVVYIAFGSHSDNPPYHGWVFGYSASTLKQVLVFNANPNGSDDGIWQSGGGLSADAAGNIYFTTGNGTFDVNTGGVDYGDSVLKINSSGTVLDYFTPSDQANDNSGDLDLGTSNPLLLPDQSGTTHPHMLVQAGKDGNLYVVNRDNMGHYNPNNDSQIIQTLVNIFPHGGIDPTAAGNYSNPVYYNGTVYFDAVRDAIKAFSVSNGLLSTSPTSQTSVIYAYPGGTMAVSANGNTNGILWAIERTGASSAGVLRAYDPTNLANEFYDSTQAGSRDTLDVATKFSVPLIANGRVYVGSTSQLTIYGLLLIAPGPVQALGGPAAVVSTQPLPPVQVPPSGLTVQVSAAPAIPPGVPADTVLQPEDVQSVFAAAVERWAAAGADVSRLANVQIKIAKLSGGDLGLTEGNTIWLDVNAAGYGWFVDATPQNDNAFTTPGDHGQQGHMDLLTVLDHELGHVLGLGDSNNGVMSEYLAPGTRLSPAASDLANVDQVFVSWEAGLGNLKL
jgi:hypothetical protein